MVNSPLPTGAVSVVHKKEISTIGKVAAHVPDLIVYGDFSQEVPFTEKFDGVLLFIDISGFTALTETFSMSSSFDYGADQLTQTLNQYVGDIVEEVMIFGGDVLKFAGDALLALWKVDRRYINDIITLALKCSLSIQQEYGLYETDVGLTLRVKIGLSAGHISKVVIGDKRHQHFLVIGRAVDEVRLSQNLAKAGEIILSPNCWELCHQKLIVVEKIPDERAVKLKYIKDVPTLDEEMFYEKCAQYLSGNHISESSDILRNASVLPPNEEHEKRLRKFVTRNILKKIDDDQPLEYLSELRPITTVFVNLQFLESANIYHLTKAIQDANAYITETVRPFRGKINKIFMFDKGCTFLCIFGLPGDKQANESTQALDCAYKIHTFCAMSLMKIKVVSIGVTCGLVFCGVVGHHLRHEYTVVGRKVNLAARIMMYYPGLVTCDETTYLESKLPFYFFQEVPVTEMKGILNPGTIYRFLGITEKTLIGTAYLTKQRSQDYPLLGRKRETELFEVSLETFKDSRKSHIMLYEGLFGYGKSQLMAEIAYLGQTDGQRVVAVELGKINVSQNFFTVQTLMAIFLGIDTCKTYDARQRIILNKIRGIVEDSYFCLLNRLFHVKFPASEEVSKMDNEKKNEEMETVLIKILQKAAEKEILIFVIDEAHFIDSASWGFLEKLLRTIPIFVVMSLSPFKHQGLVPCSAAARILGCRANSYIKLRELTPAVIVQKACQDLGVVSIARELEMFLIHRSHGNPFYCEELLRNLHLNNVLQFYVLENDEESEDEWDRLFTTRVLSPEECELLENEEKGSYICTVKQNVKLHDIMLPPTLKGVALSKIDNMNPSEQMVVKCAAIIGKTFSTHLLLHILPKWTKMKMNQTLAALVETHIFECFTEGKTRFTSQTMNVFTHELGNFPKSMAMVGQVSDLGSVIANSIKQEEAVMQCKSMGFCTPLLQEAAYELWLKSQKRNLHLKCVSYLESDAHRCKCCGQGDFVNFHQYVVDGMLRKADIQELKNESERDMLSEAASVIVSQTLICLNASIQESRGESFVGNFWEKMGCKRRTVATEPGGTGPSFLLLLSDRMEDTEKAFLSRLDEIIWLLEYGVKKVKTKGSCSCEETVDSVIVPLSHHCMALGQNSRAFYYLLESAAAYVHLSNNYMAFMYLNTAESLLKSLDPKQKIISHFEKSVLYSLKGEVSYNMGQYNLAKKLARKALEFSKRSFPLTIVGAFFMSMVENSKHRSHQKKRASWQAPRGREKRLAILYQQCRCLSLLWQIFCRDPSTNSKKFAHLAALMMVNCAEESQDECQIVSSYMEFSLCCQAIGNQQEWRKYEEMVIKHSSHLGIVGTELFTVVKLASSLAYMKLCLGSLPLAIQLGYRVHQMCVQTKKFKLNYNVLANLFKALFLNIRYKESVQVLSWLENLSFRDDNVIGKAYFISGCLDLLLYAGFAYKPFQYCLDFILANATNCILVSQTGIMLCLYSSVGIWFARLHVWEDFKEPFEKARMLVRRTCASLVANYGFCKFVECEALLLQKYIEERPDKVREWRSKTSRNLEQALAQCSTTPVCYPRLYHLKAYVQLMLGHDEQSQTLLDMAFQSCNDNNLERSWLEFSREWWFTGKDPMEDWWLKSAPNFPVWKVGMSATDLGSFDKNKYLLKMPELDIDNLFPEMKSDDQIT
ncbi:adenylate cyclase type 10-like [Eublepharis macularius]|uniref:Adenylate cyclase type 10-like n=1 Tax=Eublepharis macularius TaxID=481883 RepID=A0AA97IV13_EUBMA|nr:adenylate cyclase type 10-like [Eublepharis macularius]